MRRFFYPILALASATLLTVSCEQNKVETPVPEINIVDEFRLSYEGGEISIPFDINNPVEGAEMGALCEASWVSGATADDTSVTFTATENTGEARKADLILTYTYSEGQVTKTIILSQSAAGEEPEPDPNAPQLINNGEGTIVAAPEGGDYTISYSLVNPTQDGVLNVKSYETWVNDVDANTLGTIRFSISANTTKDREGSIIVSYIYGDSDTVSFEVAITQKRVPVDLKDVTFTFEPVEITLSSATIDIIPSDAETPYIVWFAERNRIEGMTDDEIFEVDMLYAEQVAAMFSASLTDYLEQIRLITGTYQHTQTKLNSGAEYYIYAYGVDNSGSYPARTTAMSKYLFSTKAGEAPAEGINLDVEISEGSAYLIATPDDNDRYYYFDWLSESILTDAGHTEGTAEERILAYTYNDGTLNELYREYFPVSKLCFKGPQTYNMPIDVSSSDETYYFFAFYVDDDAQKDSDFYLKTYTGGEFVTAAVPGRASFLRK
ncbi:MAG TPA: hypothetical protein IAC03_07620 [Candidatus Coprenecus pullistercoris]|nr:hypothetical protein [Candidatus Coprenecus pullistercoris]